MTSSSAHMHARPVPCPRCGSRAPMLIFDSWPRGMVCRRCHEQLIGLRREVLGFTRRLRSRLLGSGAQLGQTALHDNQRSGIGVAQRSSQTESTRQERGTERDRSEKGQ
jgi:hypothetical protein